MRKLMKKKVSLLGKEFSVFALVAVAMIGLASAALVPYLSLAITGDATVSSPITVSGTLNDTHTLFGGETLSKTIVFTNNANVPTMTHGQVVITSTNNWTSGFDEFDDLILEDDAEGIPYHLIDLGTCSLDATEKIMTCTLGGVTIGAGSAIDYTVTATVNKAIQPGAYTFSVQAMA